MIIGPRGSFRALSVLARPRVESVAGIVILLVALGLMAAVGVMSMSRPAFGDGQAYMIPNGLHMMDTINPFIYDEVHPPAYFMLEGLVFRVLGPHVEVAHAMVSLFAIFGIVGVYLLGSGLRDHMTGAVAALLVAAWPPYLVQSTLIRLDMPVAVLTVWTLLAAHRGWAWAYVLAGSMAVLTKAPGVIMPGALAGLSLLGWWRPRFPRIVLWIPVLVFGSWITACKLHYGWFFLPENVDDFSRRKTALAMWNGFQYWARRLMMEQRAWIPAGIALFAGCITRPSCLLPLPLGLLAGLFVPTVSLESGIALGLFAGVGMASWRLGGIWRSIPVVGLLFMVLFSPYHYQFPRYLLPAWPGIALLTAAVLRPWYGGWCIAAGAAVFMVSASFSVGTDNTSPWTTHESTFETVEFVRCREEAVNYLTAVYVDGSVITTPKAADDLSIPSLGYIDAPLPVAPPVAGCRRLSRCTYYYELSTRSRKAEGRIRRRLTRCGIRMTRKLICRWKSPLGSGHAAVYRLKPGKSPRKPAKQSAAG